MGVIVKNYILNWKMIVRNFIKLKVGYSEFQTVSNY